MFSFTIIALICCCARKFSQKRLRSEKLKFELSIASGYSPERKNWEEHDATIFRLIRLKYKKLCGVRAKSTLFLSVFSIFGRGKIKRFSIFQKLMLKLYRVGFNTPLIRNLTIKISSGVPLRPYMHFYERSSLPNGV